MRVCVDVTNNWQRPTFTVIHYKIALLGIYMPENVFLPANR